MDIGHHRLRLQFVDPAGLDIETVLRIIPDLYFERSAFRRNVEIPFGNKYAISLALTDNDLFGDSKRFVGEQDDALPFILAVIRFDFKMEGLRRQCLGLNGPDPGTGIRHDGRDAEVALDVDGQIATFRLEFVDTGSNDNLRFTGLLPNRDFFGDSPGGRPELDPAAAFGKILRNREDMVSFKPLIRDRLEKAIFFIRIRSSK